MEQGHKEEFFELGLCLAGAISAGAYTAGVIDRLIEALEDWEVRKKLDPENTPQHQVKITTIGGASAGGMTAMITASIVHEEYQPMKEVSGEKFPNKLYDSWVNMVAEDMLTEILKTNDLDDNTITSLLNSNFIDQISEKAMPLEVDPKKKVKEKSYFSKKMKVFLTLTNLNSFENVVDFDGASGSKDEYFIQSFNDYACFKLAESESEYSNDGWMPLNFEKEINTSTARVSSMATGAYPGGLNARVLKRKWQYLWDNDWINPNKKTLVKHEKGSPKINKSYIVDGGMINNEPFEYLKKAMCQRDTKEEPELETCFSKINKTIVLIDPFPSQQYDYVKHTGIINILGGTLNALIGQSRIKTSDFNEALDINNGSQFIIAPSSKRKEEEYNGSFAIASGCLGGFGGFIKKDFRKHDFYLGRMNCEKFLRNYFTFPEDSTNPIFINGYKDVLNKAIFKSTKVENRLQIIPLFSDVASKNVPEYPKVSAADVKKYLPQIKNRIQKIMMNSVGDSSIAKVKMWMGCKVLLNKKIANAVMKTILKSLKEHDLLNE